MGQGIWHDEKSTADPSGNYADYLAGTVESNKDSFTEDELKTLNDDIETIRKIEEKIAAIEKKKLYWILSGYPAVFLC